LKNKIIDVIKKLYIKIVQDEVTALGAQVAYYLILSFFPFLIFLLTLISYTEMISGDSLSLLSNFVPKSVYLLIIDVTQNMLATRSTAFISIGMLATIWSASIGTLAFMYGMNRAYKNKETRPFWKVRALSLLFTLALSAILLFSITLVVFGEVLGRHLLKVLQFPYVYDILWDIFRYIVSIATLLFVFILFYIYIPNCKLTVKKVLPGAILATIGWIVLSIGFAFYVNNFGNFSKTYGSIGAVIALLIWLYWSSIIVFVGSELNSILYKPDCS